MNAYGVDSPVLDLVEAMGALLLLVALVGSPLSLVLRFRRAGRDERQQIKWLALAGAVAAATFMIALVAWDLLTEPVANAAIMLSIVALPVAAGVAILRHRLYDIDVVINRTLVYGALTATLAGAYVGSVLLLQLVLSPSLRSGDRRLHPRGRGAVPARSLAYPGSSSTGASTGAGTTRSARSRPSLLASATRSSCRRSRASSRPSSTETMQPAHVSLWLRPPRVGP